MKQKDLPHLPPYRLPPTEIVVAGDGTLSRPQRFDGLRRPLRHLREEFKTLTGWGLHPPVEGASVVSRHTLGADNDGVCLSYLTSGIPAARRIVFIHGSPGRGDEWLPYLANCPRDQYRVAVDRAGYGESLPAKALPTIKAQARALVPLLAQDCIIVGYSYGSPVALQLALDWPDLVAGLLLIAGPIDPQLEHVRPLQRIAATPAVSRFLPQGLRSSVLELVPFRSDLEDLVKKLGRITARVTAMQGMRDTIVPATNATLLASYLTGRAALRSILIPDGDHYLPWTHPQTIEEALDYVLRDC